LISDGELAERRAALAKHAFDFPKSQTPWQQIQREMVAQFDEGMVLKPAVNYQRLAQTMGVPRDNH
jgi:dihydroxy-acid dehydratase